MVWIIVPAYNEGQVIGGVLSELCTQFQNIVVVDDCSSDNTNDEARRFPVHFLSHPINLGQGAALQTGISYALQNGAEQIVTFDSDGQHCVSDIPRLIQSLERFDVVLGSRFLEEGLAEKLPSKRRVLLKCATWYTRLSTGLRLTDTHNGLRAFSRKAAQRIVITQNRMAHASQILQLIALNKLSYVEVPVTIKYTDYSLAKGQKMSNSFNILWDSFAEMFR